jgi:hypothetical protein
MPDGACGNPGTDVGGGTFTRNEVSAVSAAGASAADARTAPPPS